MLQEKTITPAAPAAPAPLDAPPALRQTPARAPDHADTSAKERRGLTLMRDRVTNFRSVTDSGWLDVDRVTALIGVNESGKTNLRLPLWKLNSAGDGAIDPTAGFPKTESIALPADWRLRLARMLRARMLARGAAAVGERRALWSSLMDRIAPQCLAERPGAAWRN